MDRKLLEAGLILLALLAAWVTPANAGKNHVVRLKNGDRLTGEVKLLERGQLTFKTDATETITIKWDTVDSLWSGDVYEIEIKGGSKLYGSLASPERGLLGVIGFETVSLHLEDVVGITRIHKTFWGRVDGSIGLGVTVTSANNLLQWNLSASSKYRTKKMLLSASLSSILSDQKDVETTSRQDLTLNWTRYLPGKLGFGASGQLQSNDELGIDRRILVGAGGEYRFVHTNNTKFSSTLGMSVNSEKIVDSTLVATSIEGILGIDFESFTYEHPERDVNVGLNVYPSFSDWGRVRIELNATVAWELITDFYFSVNVLDSFDNRPPTEEASKNDLSLTTSVGYSF